MPLKPREDGSGKMNTGRPSKSKKFIEAMEKVLNEDGKDNAIILTDEDLFLLTNDLLEPGDQIAYYTFREYKNSKDENEQLIYKDFATVYKRALIKQRNGLFEKLKSEPQQWQRWAWIIERKFTEWNLRNRQEISGPEGTPVQIVSYNIPDNQRGS